MPERGTARRETGVVHLLPILLVAALLIVGAFLVARLSLKTPTKDTKASVQLQASYANPFEKDTQYVNPFASYKNPFDDFRE